MKSESVCLVAAALLCAGGAGSSADPPEPSRHAGGIGFGAAFGTVSEGRTVSVLSSSEGFEMRTVRGAPYSATAVTDIEQTLADGNRIFRRVTTSVARDSAGRTRREQSLAAVGLMIPAGDTPNPVVIHDPVAGVDYVLEPEARIARKLHGWFFSAGGVVSTAGEPRESRPPFFTTKAPLAIAGPAMPLPPSKEPAPPRREDLGEQLVEGVAALGSRATSTIPAGEIGNERPIEILSERWYSPALQVVVLSRRLDPRFGQTTYRLVDISRDEPDGALFAVPSGYTILESPSGGRPLPGPASPVADP